jgi:hypothetical protein
MSNWVLLIHELPDTSWHYDWMIQTNDDARAQLITFRIAARPDDPSCTDFEAVRIQDHRADYLSFEGDIQGERGRVKRVGQGRAEILRDDASFVVTLDAQRTWVGTRRGFESPEYHFHLSTEPWIGHTGGGR